MTYSFRWLKFLLTRILGPSWWQLSISWVTASPPILSEGKILISDAWKEKLEIKIKKTWHAMMYVNMQNIEVGFS
jgi:hypothetical protein